MRVLKLRIVVNDHDIYECRERTPVVVRDNQPGTFFSVTNGYHTSRKLFVKKENGISFYEISSYIDNMQLITGIVLVLLFFLIYILTGIRLFMLAANLPLLALFLLLFFRRKELIQVHRLKTPGKLN